MMKKIPLYNYISVWKGGIIVLRTSHRRSTAGGLFVVAALRYSYRKTSSLALFISAVTASNTPGKLEDGPPAVQHGMK